MVHIFTASRERFLSPVNSDLPLTAVGLEPAHLETYCAMFADK